MNAQCFDNSLPAWLFVCVVFLAEASTFDSSIATPPIASLSERWKNRQIPLLVGLVALIGSQVMIMEAPSYWLMCLARVFQGISSSVVWVVGLALL